MSTTTTTAIASTPQDTVSLKAYHSPSSSARSTSSTMNTATTPTLQSLYRRAANAILYRNFDLTQTLIQQAFAIIKPPESEKKDGLEDERRRWDILRVTLETTVYQAPLNSTEPATALPESLRSLLTLTPPSHLSSLYERSVRLFTPTTTTANGNVNVDSIKDVTHAHKPRATYLPPQIVHVLMMASLRLECPEIARSVFEDWLEQRRIVGGGENENDAGTEGKDGVRGKDIGIEEKENKAYAKVVELFCVHVLPRLYEWEYARDFLEYDGELGWQTRERLKSLVEMLRKQEIETARSIPTPPPERSSSSSSLSSSSSKISSTFSSPNILSPGRTPSPAPSTASTTSSSSNSSMDTASTHTVVPTTPRGGRQLSGSGSISTLSPTPSSASVVGVGVGALAAGRLTSNSISNTTASSNTSSGAAQKYANGHAVQESSTSYSSSRHSHSQPNGNGNALSHHSLPSNSSSSSKHSSSNSNTVSNLRRSPRHAMITSHTTQPNILSLLKTYLRPHLTTSKIVFAILFVIVPIVSLILRIRRKRLTTGGPSSSSNVSSRLRLSGTSGASTPGGAKGLIEGRARTSVEEVKRRLTNNSIGSGGNILSSAWREVYRAVADAVKMAGSGLV